jgi:hypothetical protein
MLKDGQGLLVTTGSAEAIAAINRFIDQSLAYGTILLPIFPNMSETQ